MLYQLQVLADLLRSTHKKRSELKKLKDQNDQDFHTLETLLLQQKSGLEEAVQLKYTVYKDMYRLSENIRRTREYQAEIQARIDYKREVALDKQMTSNRNTLQVKYKELNQLSWQIGEPLRHPSYLKALLNGQMELVELYDVERNLQMAFNGFDLSYELSQDQETLLDYLKRLSIRASVLLKKVGGVSKLNSFLKLSDADCKNLSEGIYENLTAEDEKFLAMKSAPAEEKRAARARIKRIKDGFTSGTRSFSKLSSDPRPKEYEEYLKEAALFDSIEDIKSKLNIHLPFSVDGNSADIVRLSKRFTQDLAINENGSLHVFQEKLDRLEYIQIKMSKVEEFQGRELKTEEEKVSLKLTAQDHIKSKIEPKYLTRFERISQARNHIAVATIHRNHDGAGVCSACQVVMSKSLQQRVRKLQGLETCQSCQRILVPFAHIQYIKEEVDPLLVSEEERIAMEERGELGFIPACSNCENPLYKDKTSKEEIHVADDFTTRCDRCHAFLIALPTEEEG
jgi:predicted  nucleic acid-binding Zn-ribbon protein